MLQGALGAVGVNPLMANVLGSQAISTVEGHPLFRWFPTVIFGLRHLFAVSHSFVLRKLLLLLCPFIKRTQGAASSRWGDHSPGADPSDGRFQDGLKVDADDADLYIPAMAYITYVLLYGVQRGIMQEKTSTPEVLSSTFSFAFVLFILEVGGFYMAFYFASSPMPVLELCANAGYKYFHVMLMVLVRIILGGNV